MTNPPKPHSRGGRAGVLRFLWLLRKDVLSAQSPRLYHAQMAEFRTPLFRSYVVNDPKILRVVLQERPEDFPKSPRMGAALRPLLGDGVFLAEGEDWRRLSAMVSPLIEAEPRRAFPHIYWAGQAALQRLEDSHQSGASLALEPLARRITADVMYRLLFSRPITDEESGQLLACFDAYEASAPLVSLGAVFPGLRGRSPAVKPATEDAARGLRKMVARAVAHHRRNWLKGKAQGDLVSRLFEARDPETGDPMSKVELVDQVTTLLLAGHETSASALAWALYLMALNPVEQTAVSEEAERALAAGRPDRSALSRLDRSRNVVRETLRLYPPLPMLVRQTTRPERFRDRDIPQGSQIILSPWHLHRHQRHWDDADAFHPGRWKDPTQAAARRAAFMPFSSGPRACPGAGLAMAETTLVLSMICRDWVLRPEATLSRPMARLTLRGAPPLSVTVAHRRRSDGT